MYYFNKNKLEQHLYHPFWQSFYMIALVLSMTIIISSGLLFVWQRYFVSEDLENILPARNTVLLARLDLNPFKTQTHNFRNLIGKYPEIAPAQILKEFKLLEEENVYNSDLEITPWMGHKSSFVILEDNEEFYPLLFLQYTDSRILDIFIKERLNTIDQEAQPSLLFGSQKFYFEVLDNYLALSTSPLTLGMLDQEEVPKLRQDPIWQELQDKVPAGKILNVFFRPKQYYEFLLGSQAESKLASLVSSYFKKVDAAMARLTINSDSAKISISASPSQYLSAVNKSYSPSLLGYVAKEDVYFLNGTDLNYKLTNTTDNLSSNKIALGIPWSVFDSVWKDKSGLDLNSDILEFINGEYLYLEGVDNNSQRFLLKISADRQEQLIQNLKQALEAYIPQINSSKVSRTLPDGSSYQELVASSPVTLELSEEEVEGQKILSYKYPKLDFGLYYFTMGDVLVLAPHLEGIKLALQAQSLKLDPLLSELGYPVSELSLINLESFESNKHSIPVSDKILDFTAKLNNIYPDLLLNQSIDATSIKSEIIFFNRNYVE
ncbi:MAG: hypothetical protein PHU71_01070 [Candidatus Gracilibacteria bacterium]|nr:hypothetical protein [Candidatus Gracilibacteria bacterium]